MTTEILRSKDYEKNKKQYGDKTNSCFHCMRPTNEEYLVHMLTTGELTDDANEKAENCGGSSQGFFSIGPECMKKYPKQFIFDRKYRHI